MLALPTLRSGYSEHNHSAEKPGLALPAASFSPTLPHPRAAHSHSKASRILGCQLGMGAEGGSIWSLCKSPLPKADVAPLSLTPRVILIDSLSGP